MLLMIDNYDSFVHNLARYFQRLGQETLVVRNDAIGVSEIRNMRPRAIVLSPGPCSPREAGRSLHIVRSLYTEFPMLGVCLGHQTIAEALGGEVVRANRPVHGSSSRIWHTGSGLFCGLPSPCVVGRYHSLIANIDTLPAEFKPTAWTDDNVLMAFEHANYPVYGVQFHPESILTQHGIEILANFLTLSGCDLSHALDAGNDELTVVESREPIPARPVTF